MDNLDTWDLPDIQLSLVIDSVRYPSIITGSQMRTAYALQRKGWGTVEAGGAGEMIFRLNQAGSSAFCGE